MRSTFFLLALLLLLTGSFLFSQQDSDQQSLGTNPFDLMQFVNASTGWIVGQNGLIRKTTDGGVYWTDEYSGVSKELFGVSFVDTLRGWVCGRDGAILHTTDGGETWKRQNSGTMRLCKAIRFIDPLHGWTVCEGGVVLATTDGGTLWISEASETTSSLCSVAFTSAQNGWACGSNGALLKTTNGGNEWTTTIIGTNLNLWGVAFGDVLHGCVVGSDLDYEFGKTFTTTDGGETWIEGQVSVPPLFMVQLFPNNSGWIMGRSGTVLKTSDGGNSWTYAGTPIPYWLSLSSFIDMKTGWVSDPKGNIMRTTDGGKAWTPQFPLPKPAIASPKKFEKPANGRDLFAKNDKRLNDVYQKLLFAKRGDKIFIKNLKATERIWIQFRDAQWKLRYPNHPSIEKRNELPMNQAMYLAHLTQSRIKDLLELTIAPAGGTSTYRSLADDRANGINGIHHTVSFVSDLRILHSGHIHGGIGLDKPYWSNELAICGKKYMKGIVIHPENGGTIAYAEFALPIKGRRLLGTAGWAEEAGADHPGAMRFRILVDGQLLFGKELKGKEMQELNLDLGTGRILRIETDDGLDGNEADHMAFGDLRVTD